MAFRTDADKVRTIMGLTDSDYSDPIMEAYITGANRIVTDNLGSSGLNEDSLAEIERWLSAHLLAVSQERFSKKEGAGGASIEYAGEWKQGLSGTSYGQTAIALDSTGTLLSLSGSKVFMYAVPTTHL